MGISSGNLMGGSELECFLHPFGCNRVALVVDPLIRSTATRVSVNVSELDLDVVLIDIHPEDVVDADLIVVAPTIPKGLPSNGVPGPHYMLCLFEPYDGASTVRLNKDFVARFEFTV